MHLRDAKISALNYALVLYYEPICVRLAILSFSSLYLKSGWMKSIMMLRLGQYLTPQPAITKTERPMSGSQGLSSLNVSRFHPNPTKNQIPLMQTELEYFGWGI